MTPVRAQLEGIIDAQRRKQLLATVIAALVETLLVAALLYAVMRIGLPNLVLSKPRRIALSALVLVVFVLAMLVEQARQSRSTLFWAKRIDDTNTLEDHLVTALSFADPVTSGFEQACVNALVTRLHQTQLRLPDVRLERLWLLMPAIVIALGTGLAEYRRRQRPHDDGHATVILEQGVGDRAARLGDDKALVRADAKLRAQVQAVKKTFADLVGKRLDKESVLAQVSAETQRLDAFDRENASVTQAALQLGDPSTQRAQALLSAIQSGQAAAVNKALETLQKALNGEIPPPLSTQERSEIEAVLDQLVKASADQELGEKLKAAAAAVADPARNAEAARALAALGLPLGEQITREQATRQLETQLRALLAETRRETDIQVATATQRGGGQAASPRVDGGNGAPGATGIQGAPDHQELQDGEGTLSEGGSQQEGNGAGSARSDDYKGGQEETTPTSKDVRVSSRWVGAPIRQLVAASANNNKEARDSLREQLKAQTKVSEREVMREEIPAQYAQPIQRYFFNLQQQDWERPWKPSK